jgi:hypothetical protein
MKRHATDLVSLIFGVVFVLAAAWWYGVVYLDLRPDLNLPNFGWIIAGLLIVLGLLGLAASFRRDPAALSEPATMPLPPTPPTPPSPPSAIDDGE